jgi:hypothetical protein
MAKHCLDAISVTLNTAYCLRIGKPESLLGMKPEANVRAEAVSALRFDVSSCESVQLLV